MTFTRFEPVWQGSTPTGGDQRIYEFPNGFGASVVCGPYTYGWEGGLFELAVLDANGEIDYSTPITDDVLGWLTEDAVQDLLARIADLGQ